MFKLSEDKKKKLLTKVSYLTHDINRVREFRDKERIQNKDPRRGATIGAIGGGLSGLVLGRARFIPALAGTLAGVTGGYALGKVKQRKKLNEINAFKSHLKERNNHLNRGAFVYGPPQNF